MPQRPQYDDDPMVDFETLNDLIRTMMTFGMMHEDGANEIDTAMKKLFITDEMETEYAEEYSINTDDMDSIKDDMLYDISLDEVVPSDVDGQHEFVRIFNVAINTMLHSNMYGTVYDAIKNEL